MDLIWESNYWQQGYDTVVGIDEVGRGCIAGPVAAGAVVFPHDHRLINGVNDSKLLSPKKREQLAVEIQQSALWYGIGLVSTEDIDTYGIVAAVSMAMKQAFLQCHQSNKNVLIAVDGPSALGLNEVCPHVETVIHGDRLIYSIAAASILAKVYRDKLMTQLHEKYPEYSWHQNKGYGTKAHYAALEKIGLSPYHRRSFTHL